MSGDVALIRAVSEHVTRWVGPITLVYHEIVSEKVHIDVHYVASTQDRPFEVLVTSGMSERPMSTPAGLDVPRFAEVVAILPAGWPLVGAALDDERNYWPVRMIKGLARYPHENEAWLGHGHSLSEGDGPSAPFAPNTRLNAVILLPPVSLPRRFSTLRGTDRGEINFWAAVPLYWEELDLKLREGTDALLDAFARHGITDRIDPHRPNTAICDASQHAGRSIRLVN